MPIYLVLRILRRMCLAPLAVATLNADIDFVLILENLGNF